MKEAYLYEKLPDKKVRCRVCNHYCLISNGEYGKCYVRENKNGKLYSLNYNLACALNIDPIEKKPLFHFLPGTYSLSLCTAGCNFQCQNCQNWQISQGPRLFKKIEGSSIPPQKIVELALKNKIPSISYTYTEPTVFLEYALDAMKVAKSKGLKNIWVSNGFFSEETFNLVSPYLDALNIDLKSFSEKVYQKYFGGRLRPVLETLKRIKKAGIWLEVTTLIIPGISDSKKEIKSIVEFIKTELGPGTPWHISRFSGEISWKLQNISDTPVETIKKAVEIGKSAGLKYVYAGNLPGSNMENTYCPKCGALAVKRKGYAIQRYDKDGHCPKCGTSLNFVLK